jgi:hypothetical protein
MVEIRHYGTTEVIHITLRSIMHFFKISFFLSLVDVKREKINIDICCDCWPCARAFQRRGMMTGVVVCVRWRVENEA